MKSKRLLTVGILILFIMAMLGGCGTPNDTQNTTETTPSAQTTTTTTEETTEVGNGNEEDPSYYIEEVYSQQIGRYYTPLCEIWDAGKYLDNGLSLLPSNYYTGTPLENVGFGLVDLDNDGSWELVIGAIMYADTEPVIFEIWTLENGEPVMLAQSGNANRYYLQYAQEKQTWRIANETAFNIASHATYYMTLEDGKLQVEQGIVFDASADEENPWFMTNDLDWDVSNDTPIDEETANEMLETNRQLYTVPEYVPYTQYPSDTPPVNT